MTDSTEDTQPPKPRATYSMKMPTSAEVAAALAEEERTATPGQRAFRDMKRGISPFPESRAERAYREAKLGVGISDVFATAAMKSINTDALTRLTSGISDVFASSVMKGVNTDALSVFNSGFSDVFATALMKGINIDALSHFNSSFANVLATSAMKSVNTDGLSRLTSSFAEVLATSSVKSINTDAFSHLTSGISDVFTTAAMTNSNSVVLATAPLQAAAAYLSKVHYDQNQFAGAFSALKAAQMSMLKADFTAGTDRPAGALGRLDAVIHEDAVLGAAVDGLLAAPSRQGPVGFTYGDVQRRARQVDDVLSEGPSTIDLAQTVEEAQDAAGLEYDVMFDLSQFLGIPAPQRSGGPSAAKILFVATIGTTSVVLDIAFGSLAPSSVLAALLNGRDLWDWLRDKKNT